MPKPEAFYAFFNTVAGGYGGGDAAAADAAAAEAAGALGASRVGESAVHASSSPLAKWTAVAAPGEMQAGDILVYCPNPPVHKQGHIVVLMERPLPPTSPGGKWTIKIADSSSSPHTNDSGRSKAEGGATGMGTGEMGLLVDRTDGNTYLTWGSSEASTKRYGPVLAARASL